MNRGARFAWVFTSLFFWSTPLAAQGVAVGGHAGTLGLGADVSLGLTRQIGIRAGLNLQPYSPSQTFDDVEYTVDFASPSVRALLDLYPGLGGLRLTGGVVLFRADLEVRAELTQPVEIGGQMYSPQEIGTLSGVFDTKDVAPYAGIGFGRLGGRRGIGMTVDLGVAFHGEPGVRLVAAGPVASMPQFQTDLAREEQNLADDARSFRYYPVLAVGFVVGFRGF
jgi:hypothetical protein